MAGHIYGRANGPGNATAANWIPVAVDANGVLQANSTGGNVTIQANATVDLNKIGGNAVAFNQGVVGNGVQRMVLASDVALPRTGSFGLASQARFTSNDASGGAAAVTIAPTSGQKLVITDIIVAANVPMRADFSEETSGTIFASVYLSANTTVPIQLTSKLKLNTADKKLMVRADVAGRIDVTAGYYSEV